MSDEKDFADDPGMGIVPELCDGQCMSLAQLLEMAQEAIRQLPADTDPHDVAVSVAGRVENGEGESFYLQDLYFAIDKNEKEEALLITDGSGRDETMEEL